MTRERYVQDYEDFEPEMRTWPFLILSLLLPLIPFVLTIVLGGGFTPALLFSYTVAVLPLFSTALSIKDGERSWMLLVSGVVYSIYIIVSWAVKKAGGEALCPLGIPFSVAVTPSLLSLIAFAFFNKRRRKAWLGWTLIAFILSGILTFITYREASDASFFYVFYPVLVTLLTLFLFIVTRRTESTPWYFAFLLVLLVFASFGLYPGLGETYVSGTVNGKVNITLKCFLYSFSFWYTLSFLFVFSGLAGKSCYRKRRTDDDDSDADETMVIPPSPNTSSIRTGYTNPPDYSRFDRTERQSPVKEEDEAPSSARPAAEEAAMRSTAGTVPRDDKWYDFLEGGVKTDSRDSSPRRRDDYYDDRDYSRSSERDRYYRDERRYRDDRISRDYYRDDRDYPSRYRDDRDGRDRDYYSRRDYERDRDYDRDRDRDRDRDYYRDRDRRYYDDEYPPYDDRRRN